jgi:hypothetical protein
VSLFKLINENTPINRAEYMRLNFVARWEFKSLMERREEQYVRHFQTEQQAEQEKPLSC